jgi:hypothetical protein
VTEIDILLPRRQRRWHLVLADRLRAAGHHVRLIATSATDTWPVLLDAVLAAERRFSHCDDRLSMRIDCKAGSASEARPGALKIDLSGRMPAGDALSLRFDASPSAAAAAIALAAGRLPDLAVLRGGRLVARARPMVDSRLIVGRGLEDVLARAVSLLVTAVGREAAGKVDAAPAPQDPAAAGSLAGGLLFGTAPRLLQEAVRRVGHWPSHWRVGYRFHDGRGVAETGSLAGPGWRELPDDGLRYYADPFPFEWEGRSYLFVEEYPHQGGKGLISVCEFDRTERPSVPRVVLEEPFHLSYPQVFAMGGEVWMLPEGGAGRQLVLYRAAAFPDRWERHAVLVDDRELFDATILEHEGRFWLFAAERDGVGSTSDMLVVFHADRLEGPWRPHRGNPILIDRAAARPGGAATRIGRRIVLPVQDGTLGYGGGLGLADLLRLDEEAVEFAQPVPLLRAGNWPYPRIHTLNRAGRLEVIDGIAETRRRAPSPRAAA